jgi:hypothetical protein
LQVWQPLYLAGMCHKERIKIFVLHTLREVTLSFKQDMNVFDMFKAAIAGDILYLMGGKYTFKGGDTNNRGMEALLGRRASVC